jgi:hypothetical protein
MGKYKRNEYLINKPGGLFLSRRSLETTSSGGTFYFKVGPFRFGRNSENIRKVFLNQFAHDFLTRGGSKWFEVLDLKPGWYWGFGYSGGGTLY